MGEGDLLDGAIERILKMGSSSMWLSEMFQGSEIFRSGDKDESILSRGDPGGVLVVILIRSFSLSTESSAIFLHNACGKWKVMSVRTQERSGA